jgi:hypothetical protein
MFVSERGAPFSIRGFQAIVERAANAAGFHMKIRQTAEPMSGRLAHQLNWTHFFDFLAFFGFMTLLLGAALTPRSTMSHYK